ncbi:hypothetical protein WR25_11392 [Diploscapter pachys]|uniref:Uncharacterized protein n=1 Tax=Diploscapter pachys TaxID=2018661 RepID=A0A2A2L317_9BILA|nr:hypothetical protein WR25_26524 [Diploscapter pachys]PAV80539.1 hypothetical protein WR25_11392 [Diploscapter pachys]
MLLITLFNLLSIFAAVKAVRQYMVNENTNEDLRPYLDDGSDDVRWIQKRHVDPLNIPRMVKEPPLKRDISSKKSVSDL